MCLITTTSLVTHWSRPRRLHEQRGCSSPLHRNLASLMSHAKAKASSTLTICEHAGSFDSLNMHTKHHAHLTWMLQRYNTASSFQNNVTRLSPPRAMSCDKSRTRLPFVSAGTDVDCLMEVAIALTQIHYS